MKWIFSIIFFMLSVCSMAQQVDSTESVPAYKKLYVGVELNTVAYMPRYDDRKISGGVQPLATLHVGYRLNRRLNVQVGIGYSKDKEDYAHDGFENEGDTEITRWDEYNTTKGLVVPVSFQFTPFNPAKRLQFYATAAFVPVFGSTKLKKVKKKGNASTILYDVEASGTALFFTGGLLLKYRISNRLDGYIEGNLIYKDMLRQNNYADSGPMSAGIGINYNLR